MENPTFQIVVDKRTGRFATIQIEDAAPNADLQHAVRQFIEPGETFRVIDGTDLYGISDRGRVFSVYRKKMLKPAIDRWGHARVNIAINGKYTFAGVHRLVAQAFIPNPHVLPVVRHVDDDKSNNTPSNLCWGTQEDNNNDFERNYWFRRMAYIEEMDRLGIVTGSAHRRKLWEWARLIVLDPDLYKDSLYA